MFIRAENLLFFYIICDILFSLSKLNFSSISPRALTPNKSMWETCLRAQFVSLNTPAMKNFFSAESANKK